MNSGSVVRVSMLPVHSLRIGVSVCKFSQRAVCWHLPVIVLTMT